MLSSIFDTTEEDINVVTKRFLKKVDGAIAMSFRKTRVIRREDKRIYELNDKIRSMKNNSDEMSQNEVKKAEEALAQIEHDNINS